MSAHEMNWLFGFLTGFVFCRIMVWLEIKVDSFFRKLKQKKDDEKPFANQFIPSLCECGAYKASQGYSVVHAEWCPVKKLP